MEYRNLSEKFETYIWPVYTTRSKNTEKTRNNLHMFLDKLAKFSQKDLLEISDADAIQFSEYLYESMNKGKWKPSYIKVMLISLRKFYQFLHDYRYEFLDRGIEVPSFNPFDAVTITIPDKVLLTAEDLPNLQQLDLLLEESAKTNRALYLAISLAAKMGLSVSEISNLRKSNVGYMKEELMFSPLEGDSEKHLYICLNAVGEHGKTKRYLKVPKDLEIVLNESLEFMEKENADAQNYVILYKERHYSDRTMQYQLKKLCEKCQIKQITFQDLRNLAVFLMKDGGADQADIAHYTGQEGRWLTRFSGVDAQQIFDSGDFVQIALKTKKEK